MFMKEYDSYQGEAFDIHEDRTYRFRQVVMEHDDVLFRIVAHRVV